GAPRPPLTIAPTPLVLAPLPQDADTCSAVQTIANNTTQRVGWTWQKPAASGFHFQVNGVPQGGWPGDVSPGIAPGGRDALPATGDCKPQPQSFGILVTDTRGNQYTFVLQVR